MSVLPRQSSPSTRARRRLGLRVGIRPCAQRQQGAARRCTLQPLPCAASRSSTQLVRTCCRARIACASRFATRQPIPTVARASAGRCLGAVRRTYPPDMYDPGARSTHRPQAVVIPRLRHLGWPRMRGVASVRSHYAQIAGEPAGHADQTGLPDPVWRSRRCSMGPRAAAMPRTQADWIQGSWEHFKLY